MCCIPQLHTIAEYLSLRKLSLEREKNCQHVEKRLDKACSKRRMKFVGKSGAVYRKVCQKDPHLAQSFTELVTVGEAESAFATEKAKWEKIEKVNEELQNSLSEAQVVDPAKTKELFVA